MGDRPDFLVEIRHTFGAARLAETPLIGLFPPRDVPTTIYSILGKGVVYGGYISTTGPGIKNLDYVIVTIDGVTITEVNYITLISYNIVGPWDDLLHILYYDDVTWRYAMGYMPGITFETGFKVEYVSKGPIGATVHSRLIYALI